MRVNTTLLIVFVTLLTKASSEDLYLEGEDEANEFLEVDRDTGIGGHLRRLKRAGFFDWFQPSSPKPAETATVDDDELIDDDNDLNGGSGAIELESEPEKEKTLRVTFVVMEPYRVKYSNRDSPQFQNFSKSLAEAVNTVFRDLPGTHRASLVRIQSRPADEFSCKVTLDIVVTGDDTDRVSEVLRDYIRNRRMLGNVAVNDEDYSATVIDSGYVDNEAISQSEDQYNIPERGDGIPDTTELPDLLEPDDDNIFGIRPIGAEESETTEEIMPDGNDYERPTEDTPLSEPEDGRDGYGRTTEGKPDYGWTTEGTPDDDRYYYSRPTEGRPNEGRPNEERNDNGRSDDPRPDGGNVGPTERPDDGRNYYERSDYDRPTEGRSDYGRSTEGIPNYGRPTEGIPNYGRPTEGKPGYGRPTEGILDYGRSTEGKPNYGRPSEGQSDYGRSTGRPDNTGQGGYEPYTETPGGWRNYTCPDDFMRCDETRCVLLSQRCDNRRDCDDGADEMGCPDSFTDNNGPPNVHSKSRRKGKSQ